MIVSMDTLVQLLLLMYFYIIF